MREGLTPDGPQETEEEAMRVCFEALSHAVKRRGFRQAVSDPATRRCLEIMARNRLNPKSAKRARLISKEGTHG